MIKILEYKSEFNKIWNDFIDNSKNGIFMFNRDFMDYHSDRFKDNSLMFYDGEKLIAVLPANIKENILYSHGGLTYGGFITDEKMKQHKMIECFEIFKKYMLENHIKRCIYKVIPHIYHRLPSEEDLYALFKFGAKLYRQDVSTTIYIPDKIKFSELRCRGVKKAIKAGLEVKQTDDFDTYIKLLSDVLQEQHGAKPIHTADELRMLAGKFPDTIKLFAAYQENTMLAGVIIFDTKQTVHAQYIANSNEGRNIGALDLVMDYLINEYCKGKKYFDFGISTENGGKYLNEGLTVQKEGFGGRSIIYSFYELNVDN